MYQTTMYQNIMLWKTLSPLSGAHTFQMGRSTCSQAPTTVGQTFQWREPFGAGDTEEGFRYMWGVQGRCPSRVRSGVSLERTCCAKTLGHEILVLLVERMEEGREENRAQDTESHGAKLKMRQESLLSVEMTW